MVDDLVSEAVNIDILVGLQSIAVDHRTPFDIADNVCADVELASVREHLHAGLLCVAFQQSAYYGFTLEPAGTLLAHSHASLFVQMHVDNLAADESLIGFNLTAQFRKRATLHCKSDSVKHEPCRLLS